MAGASLGSIYFTALLCIIKILLDDVFATGIVPALRTCSGVPGCRGLHLYLKADSAVRRVRRIHQSVRKETVACSVLLWQASGQ